VIHRVKTLRRNESPPCQCLCPDVQLDNMFLCLFYMQQAVNIVE